MEHLSLSQIQECLNGRSVDLELEGHLATCEKCHKVFKGLKALKEPLSMSFRDKEATASCPEDWELGAFIKEEMTAEASKLISVHLKDCGYCIDRAAVYYKALAPEGHTIKAPDLWKKRASEALIGSEVAGSDRGEHFLSRAYSFFRGLNEKLPPLPGYGLAAAALLALLVVYSIPKKGDIITLSSSETITMRDSEIPSSFGFSGAGETIEVKNMEVFYKGENVVFKWKPVKDVVQYEFSVIDKAEGKEVISFSSGQPVALIDKARLTKNRLYGWVITGKTEDDGRYFEHRGDFVLAK